MQPMPGAAVTLPPAIWLFVLILAACLAGNVTDPDENPIVAAESRATATGWVTVAAIAYSSPVWGLWVAVVAVVGFVQLVRTVRGRRHFYWLGEWASLSVVNFAVAALWLPLSAILRAVPPAQWKANS